MKNRQTQFALVLLIFLVLGAGALVTHSYIMRAHQNAQVPQSDDPSSPVYPYGKDGRNIKHAGQTVDMMADSISNHMLLMAAQCDRLRIDRSRKTELINATYKAGMDAMNEVSVSSYTSPFQPHYPPLPK